MVMINNIKLSDFTATTGAADVTGEDLMAQALASFAPRGSERR